VLPVVVAMVVRLVGAAAGSGGQRYAGRAA
jgi:hypothetical protein